MAEYKICKISSDAPREHYNQQYDNTTYYIKVMLDNHPKPVSVGKKSADALKVGDVLSGTILPTEYDTDNFKSDPKTFTKGPFRDQSEIKAQWAIGQAVNLFISGKDLAIGGIEETAKNFFAMIDRVKSSGGNTPLHSGYEQAKQTAENLRQPVATEGHSNVDKVVGFDPNDPINLDDIPF